MPTGIYRRTDEMKTGKHMIGRIPWNKGLGKPKIHTGLGRGKHMLGRKLSDETKRKIGLAQLGRKRSPETGKRISAALMGRKLSPERIEKTRLAHIGLKWGHHSKETKLKMSLASKGKKKSPEHVKAMSISRMGSVGFWKGKKRPNVSGENNYRWISNRTHAQEKRRVRGSFEWKQWRSAVFARDNFTCKDCGVSGVYIEPHHIIPIRSDWSKLFDINNGITLCRPCHKKTMWREEEFVEKYTRILTLA